MQRSSYRIWLCCILCLLVHITLASPRPKNLWSHWESHDPTSTATINHNAWQTFLTKYVTTNQNDINMVNYAEVKPADRQQLNAYIWRLSQLDLRHYNRKEQLAYWLNLHNAVVIKTILEHYPTRSVNDINISPGFFSEGPWSAHLIRIDHLSISLDDIENRILRPIWHDARIHYALNYASIGSPNLQKTAFTGENCDELLNKAAFEFINSGRGVRVISGKLITSAIYDWFIDDFGSDMEKLLTHLRFYAKPKLLAELRHIHQIEKTVFNWHLNSTTVSD